MVVCFLLIHSLSLAQNVPGEPFVGWTFDDIEFQYPYSSYYYLPANYGNTNNAMLYMNGSYGSSYFTTTTSPITLEVSWTGTAVGDPRPSPVPGLCVGFKHPNASGKSIVLKFPTTFYSDLSLRFAKCRSNTGFRQLTYEWSLDGSNYTTFAAKPMDTTAFILEDLNLTHIPQLENQPQVFIRVTFSNIASTAYQGNIKFDNFCVYGTKCADSLVLYDTLYAGDTYQQYGFDLPHLAGDGDFQFENRVRFTDRCDSLYLLNLHLIDTNSYVDTTEVEDTVSTESAPDFFRLYSNQIKVYPNPMNDWVYLEFPWNWDRVWESIQGVLVYNQLGQIVPVLYNLKFAMVTTFGCTVMSEKLLSSCKIEVQFLEDEEPGIYFIHVKTTQGGFVKKVIRR